jgi:hypothetical protein
MPGRHRQSPFGDRHIEVATSDGHRSDDRLFRSLDLGSGASRQAYSPADSNISCCMPNLS